MRYTCCIPYAGGGLPPLYGGQWFIRQCVNEQRKRRQNTQMSKLPAAVGRTTGELVSQRKAPRLKITSAKHRDSLSVRNLTHVSITAAFWISRTKLNVPGIYGCCCGTLFWKLNLMHCTNCISQETAAECITKALRHRKWCTSRHVSVWVIVRWSAWAATSMGPAGEQWLSRKRSCWPENNVFILQSVCISRASASFGTGPSRTRPTTLEDHCLTRKRSQTCHQPSQTDKKRPGSPKWCVCCN